jgi:hypothetical protein
VSISSPEFFHMLLKRYAENLGPEWRDDHPKPGDWRGEPKGKRSEEEWPSSRMPATTAGNVHPTYPTQSHYKHVICETSLKMPSAEILHVASLTRFA